MSDGPRNPSIPQSVDVKLQKQAENAPARNINPDRVELPKRAPRFLEDRTDKWISAFGDVVYQRAQLDPDRQLTTSQQILLDLKTKLDGQAMAGKRGQLDPQDYAKAWFCVNEIIDTGGMGDKGSLYSLDAVAQAKLVREAKDLASLKADLMVYLTQPFEGKWYGLGVSSAIQYGRSVVLGEYVAGKQTDAASEFSFEKQYESVKKSIKQEKNLTGSLSAEQKRSVAREATSRLLMVRDGARVNELLAEVSEQKSPLTGLVEKAKSQGSLLEKFIAKKLEDGELSSLGERLLRNEGGALTQIKTIDGLLQYIGYDQTDADMKKIISRDDMVNALASFIGGDAAARANIVANADSELVRLLTERNAPGVVLLVSHLYKEKLTRLARVREAKAVVGSVTGTEALQRQTGELSPELWKSLKHADSEKVALLIIGGNLAIPGTSGNQGDIENALKQKGVDGSEATKIATDLISTRKLISWDTGTKSWIFNDADKTGWRDEDVISTLMDINKLSEAEVKIIIQKAHALFKQPQVDSHYDENIKGRLDLMNSTDINERKKALNKWNIKTVAMYSAMTAGVLGTLGQLFSPKQQADMEKYLQ